MEYGWFWYHEQFLWQFYWLVFMKKLFILLSDQLDTDGTKNIDSFSSGLWAAHGVADLLVTNKEL